MGTIPRSELLARVKERGYSEENPTRESVVKFCDNALLEFEDNGEVVDIAKSWDTKTSVKTDTPSGIKRATAEGTRKAMGDLSKAIAEDAPATFAIGRSKMVAKGYNAKAARGKTIFPDADTAEFAGACMRSGLAKHFNREYSQQKDDDAIIKTAITTDNTNAGSLIPVEYVASLIYNTEKAGVLRAITNVQPMSRDQQTVPRKTGIGAMSWVNEAGEIPVTDQGFDTINLMAKKGGRIVKSSKEMMEDSAIGFAETTAESVQESQAIMLDLAMVLGDGTSTYGGHTGLANAATSLVTNVAADGNSWSAVTVANCLDVYAAGKNWNWERCHWLMCREFYFTVCLKLDKAASQYRELVGPPPAGFDAWFLDKPVRFLPSIEGMPTATASGQRCAYFGDFIGGITTGLRRDLSVEFSDQAYWANDVVAWKATSRSTFIIHGHGRPATTNSNLVALRTT